MFKHCKVVDPDEPQLTPLLVLEKWSTILSQEFDCRNDHIHNQEFDAYMMQELVVAVQGNVKRMSAMERQMTRIMKTEPQTSEAFALLARQQRDILMSIEKTMLGNKNLLNKAVESWELHSLSEWKRKAREEVYNTPGMKTTEPSPPSVQYGGM